MKFYTDITTVCILEKFENRANMLFADQILKKIGFDDAAKNYRVNFNLFPTKILLIDLLIFSFLRIENTN